MTDNEQKKNSQNNWESSKEKDTDYLKKVGEIYTDDAPWNWNQAYDLYTDENAPAIERESDREKIVNILNHGKYNLRVLRISIIQFAIFLVMVWFSGTVSIFYIRPFLKILFIVVEAVMITSCFLMYCSLKT